MNRYFGPQAVHNNTKYNGRNNYPKYDESKFMQILHQYIR